MTAALVRCAVLLGLWLCSLAHAASYQARVTAVPDGDTLWVQPLDGSRPRKLRLVGIDAPEICQPFGQDAREALRALVAQRMITVTETEQDSYQRGLATLDLNGLDVAEFMVSTGQAWADRWHGRVTRYGAQEAAARAQRLGLWAHDGAQWPGEWRKQHGSCYPQWSR